MIRPEPEGDGREREISRKREPSERKREVRRDEENWTGQNRLSSPFLSRFRLFAFSRSLRSLLPLRGLFGLFAFLLAGCGPRLGSPERPLRLDDVAAAAGIRFRHTNGASGRLYLPETLGSGCAVLDYDGDGHLDLFLVNSGPLPGFRGKGPFTQALYRGDGRGHFTDVTRAAGLAVPFYGIGCAVGDYDNDGHPDLYVTALGPNHLFHNNGNGTFTDVTRQAGVGDPRFSTSAAWLDYDRDRFLDLFVCNYVKWSAATNQVQVDEKGVRHLGGVALYPGEASALYHNNGNGTFTDVTRRAGISSPTGGALGVAVDDYDDDGWPDLIVADDERPNRLYRNNRDGTFTELGVAAGIAYGANGQARAGMGVDTGDELGNGRESVVIGNLSQEAMALFRDAGEGRYEDQAAAAGLREASLPFLTFGVLLADLDLDGRLDIVSVNNGAPLLLRSTPPPGRHWLQVRVQGTRSNRDGLGTRVEIEAGGRRQNRWIRSGSSYASQNERAAFFGLGDATRIERLTVHWPNGGSETLRNVSANQRLLIREGLRAKRPSEVRERER